MAEYIDIKDHKSTHNIFQHKLGYSLLDNRLIVLLKSVLQATDSNKEVSEFCI